jgi:hypothetical protein
MNLVILHRGLFSNAKRWFAAAQIVRIGAVIGGLASLLVVAAPFVPFVVFALTAIAEGLLWRSDASKALGERALRLLEVQNGLGIDPPAGELADIAAEAPAQVREAAKRASEEPYYAAASASGPIRLLQNVQESAWWTKHLASSMFKITLLTMIGLVALSLTFLITSINLAVTSRDLSILARVVTAALMLVFSLGLFRMAVGYGSLRERASASVTRAAAAETAGTDTVAALRIVHDYQLARAAAPLIPDWIYRMRSGALDEIWAARGNKGISSVASS